MRRLRGRRLHPESGQGDRYCDADDCSPPPPALPLAPAPAPQPSGRASPGPCPPDFAPSPAPVPTASWGRREQGRVRGYGSPPGGGGDHNRRLVTYALVAVAAVAFVSLILLGVSVVVRRRQVRRRRQALLAAPAAAPAAPTDADDPGDGGGGGGGGGGRVVHHVWYIRTLGLEEAAISSIAATRYRAGAGLLGATDCTVCLGEFQDGELVRLLPKCGHAFHVPCIDTWLRAHVNCPLCRSDVLDPAFTTDAGGGAESSSAPPADPDDDSYAAVADLTDATSEATAEYDEQEEDYHPEASSAEEDPQEQPSLPEPPQLPRPLPHNVRRAASMDAAIMSTAADVAAALERLPGAASEGEQSGRRKSGPGTSSVKASGSGHGSNLGTDRPASAGIPRSFFSRHCRARSSVLPL